MVRRLSLGFCCSLLWLTVGCGQTSSVDNDGASAGTAGAAAHAGGVGNAGAGAPGGSGAATAGGSVSEAGAPTSDCQQVVFEDARVEQAVRAKLGLAEGQPLDGTHMAQLGGTLYLEAASSLAGLECSSKLGGLDLSGGKLADVSAIARLPALKTLTFRKTELGPEALNTLGPAPHLRELFFYGVPVADLSALAELPSLVSLLIEGGQVADLEPLAATKLESLLLDDNPLTELGPLASLTALRTLSIARTQVESVEPLALLGLQELNITGSPVVSLAALGAPFAPKECSHLSAENVPLADESWASDRERLCALGWGVRASRPTDASAVTCGTWCDLR